MDLFLVSIIAIVLALLLIPTYLIKRFNKGKTYYGIVSVLKFTKPLHWFDKLLFFGRFLDWLSFLGILLGFGVFGADYLYGRKQGKLKRIGIWIISFLFLFAIFHFLLSPMFSSHFTKNFEFLFPFAFALFGLAGFILFMLAMSGIDILFKIFSGIKPCPGVAPVIPGVQIPNVPFTIPWYAWIPLFLILLIHEASHGIIARKIGVKIKSTGLLLAGLFPIGAFVEPDEKKLKSSKEIDQLCVYSAGPTSNLLAMGVGFLVSTLLFSFLLVPVLNDLNEFNKSSVDRVEISEVKEKVHLCGEDFPAPAFGNLEAGMVLLGVNDKPIHSVSDALQEIPRSPGSTATFLVEKNGIQKEISLESNAIGSFGINLKEVKKEGFEFPLSYTLLSFALALLYGIVLWFVLLNFLFAIVNFLPLEPFDGGKMAKIILMPYLGFWKISQKEKEKRLNKIMIYLLLILLLINALPLFL